MDVARHDDESRLDSIFDAANICRAQLEQCGTYPALSKDHWASNRLTDFDLWNAGVGATAQKHMSLDVRLQNDATAKNVVVGILSTLSAWSKKCSDLAAGVMLSQAKGSLDTPARTLGSIPETGGRESATRVTSTISQKDNYDEPGVTLTEAKNTMVELLHTLVVMGFVIRRAGTVSRQVRADSTFEIDSKTTEYEDLRAHLEFLLRLPLALEAQNSSPSPNASDDNVNYAAALPDLGRIALTPEQLILLKATLKRRHWIRFAQRQGMKLKDIRSLTVHESNNPHQIAGTASGLSRVTTGETASKQNLGNTPRHKGVMGVIEKNDHSTISKVSNYIAFQSLEQQIQTQKEGVAATVIALRADYPKPPPHTDDVQGFQCPYCHFTLPIELSKSRSLWRKYVSEDIQPYTCFLPGCPVHNGNFNTLELWKSHVKQDHRLNESWRCLICEENFEHDAQLSAHVEVEHADVVSKDDLPTVVQMCVTFDRPRLDTCPICSINKIDWATSQERGFTSDVSSTDHFVDHIGQCLHDFALRSLPEDACVGQVLKSHQMDDDTLDLSLRSSPASSINSEEGSEHHNSVNLTSQILEQIPKRFEHANDFCFVWRESLGVEQDMSDLERSHTIGSRELDAIPDEDTSLKLQSWFQQERSGTPPVTDNLTLTHKQLNWRGEVEQLQSQVLGANRVESEASSASSPVKTGDRSSRSLRKNRFIILDAPIGGNRRIRRLLGSVVSSKDLCWPEEHYAPNLRDPDMSHEEVHELETLLYRLWDEASPPVSILQGSMSDDEIHCLKEVIMPRLHEILNDPLNQLDEQPIQITLGRINRYAIDNAGRALAELMDRNASWLAQVNKLYNRLDTYRSQRLCLITGLLVCKIEIHGNTGKSSEAQAISKALSMLGLAVSPDVIIDTYGKVWCVTEAVVAVRYHELNLQFYLPSQTELKRWSAFPRRKKNDSIPPTQKRVLGASLGPVLLHSDINIHV